MNQTNIYSSYTSREQKTLSVFFFKLNFPHNKIILIQPKQTCCIRVKQNSKLKQTKASRNDTAHYYILQPIHWSNEFYNALKFDIALVKAITGAVEFISTE